MQADSVKRAVCAALSTGMALTLAACGGGGSGSMSTTPPGAQTGNVPLVISDDSSDDWATIGVKILSIALTPQGGGAPVTVFTAPAPTPMVNLNKKAGSTSPPSPRSAHRIRKSRQSQCLLCAADSPAAHTQHSQSRLPLRRSSR